MTMTNKTALAIRPYGNHVRDLVFKVLAEACIDIEAPEELRNAKNDEIVRIVHDKRVDILLIPFHVVRFGDNERTNGLELLALLRNQVAWTRNVSAIMPISVFAKVAFEGAIAKNPDVNLYPLYEYELGSPDLPRKLEQFCFRFPSGTTLAGARYGLSFPNDFNSR